MRRVVILLAEFEEHPARPSGSFISTTITLLFYLISTWSHRCAIKGDKTSPQFIFSGCFAQKNRNGFVCLLTWQRESCTAELRWNGMFTNYGKRLIWQAWLTVCDHLHGRQKFIAFDFCHLMPVILRTANTVASLCNSKQAGRMASRAFQFSLKHEEMGIFPKHNYCQLKSTFCGCVCPHIVHLFWHSLPV